jgi:hypothetical protein
MMSMSNSDMVFQSFLFVKQRMFVWERKIETIKQLMELDRISFGANLYQVELFFKINETTRKINGIKNEWTDYADDFTPIHPMNGHGLQHHWLLQKHIYWEHTLQSLDFSLHRLVRECKYYLMTHEV